MGVGRPVRGSALPDPPVALDDELRWHDELLARGRPAVRAAVVAAPALSYGIRVPVDAPFLARARTEGLDVVPRSTGGTGLVHLDGDVVWAVVLPRTDPRVPADFVHAYPRLGAGVVRALQEAGLGADWRRAPGLSDDCCPLSARGQILSAGEAIVGGAAQHATAAGLLHHGSVSVRVDRPLIDRIFQLPSPGPSARLAGTADLGLTSSPAELAERIERGLRATLRP